MFCLRPPLELWRRGNRRPLRREILSIKDRIALVASIIAVLLSLFNFAQDNLFNQHVLRVMVVAVGGQATGNVEGDVLLVNAGKHYEVLYDARLIFAGDAGRV